MTSLKYPFKRVFSLSLNRNHVVFTSVFLLYCVHVVYIQCSLHFLQVLLLEPDKQYQPSYSIHSADYFTDAVSVVVTIVDMLPMKYMYMTQPFVMVRALCGYLVLCVEALNCAVFSM